MSKQNIANAKNANALSRAISNEEIVKNIDTLIGAREKWEKDFFNRSNEELYKVLAGCYALLVANKDNKEFVATLKQVCKSRQIRLIENGKNTSTATGIIIKLVFGPDRRRTNQYGTVLAVAKADNVPVKDFAAWIKKAGGVEEIRHSATGSVTIKGEEAMAIAKDVLKDATSTRLEFLMPGPKETFDGYVVCVARAKADGSGNAEIVQFCNEKQIQSVLTALGYAYHKAVAVTPANDKAKGTMVVKKDYTKAAEAAVAA